MKLTSIWAAALLGALTLMAGACVSKQRPAVLAGKEIPHNGGPMAAELWQAAEASSDPVVKASDRTEWPIPLGSSYSSRLTLHGSKSQAVGASGEPLAGRAYSSWMEWNDLITPAKNYFISLPLRGKYGEYEYAKGTEPPVGSHGIAFHPFWMWNWKEGQLTSGRAFSGKGIPLFYSRMSVAQKDQQVDSVLTNDNYLWTIGPRISQFDIDGSLAELSGDEGLPNIDPTLDALLSNDQFDHFSGYYANPLYLGGLLGSVLWTDYRLKASSDVWEDHHVAHGPLWGWLFYVSSQQKDIAPSGAVSGEKSRRLYVAGWLWKSEIEKDAQGNVVNNIQGPLLGGFGWGSKDGKKDIRLFWMRL